MSGVRMLHVIKDWWKFIQSHQYYTGMDLSAFINWPNICLLLKFFIVLVFILRENCIHQINDLISNSILNCVMRTIHGYCQNMINYKILMEGFHCLMHWKNPYYFMTNWPHRMEFSRNCRKIIVDSTDCIITS